MSGQNSKHALPHTPRICDRIMEYYDLFGQDRDLEKFMRIYSPCASSSQDSHRTHASSNRVLGECCMLATRSGESISAASSHDALVKMNTHLLQLSRVCCGVNSKSMPNIDAQGKAIGVGDLIMDINIDVEGANEKVFSASTECIQTPVKNPLAPAKQVPTPESVAKSHRRLEWDSLGDIGYRKSMSASNISILERSLLKEFFKENSNTSDPSSSNLEENEKNQLSSKDKQKFVELTKALCGEHATPPLASSTLVDALASKTSSRGAKPKMISQSTSSTSLQKKFEKYAQTSLLKPSDKHSQEVQVNMSSMSSAINESATPSSFEYRSSRSSRSSKSSEYIEVDNSKKHKPTRQHPFITSITELLAAKKNLSQQNQLQQLQMGKMRQLQSQFQEALEENKENQCYTKNSLTSTSSTFSLTRQAPELDLGIQLICSLIEAKSVDGKQKKKLIRNIVKRITQLNDERGDTAEASASNQGTSHSHSSASFEEKYVYDSVHSSGRNALEKSCQALLDLACDLGVAPINGGHIKSQEKANVKDYKRKERSNCENVERNVLQDDKSHNNLKPLQRSRSEPSKVLGNQMSTISNKQISHQQSKTTKENRIDPLNLSDEKLSQVKQKKETASHKEEERTTGEIFSKLKNHLLKTRSTQTSKSSINTESKKSDRSTATATTTSSSSSSHDLPTQKSLRKPLDSNNAESDQPTMREWLNPLTQSEIEYEEKKRVECERSENLQKIEKTEKKTKHDCERTQQLSWIENEIHRLECLKHLLLDDNSHEKSTTTYRSSESSSKNVEKSNESTRTDKLYDSVYSVKSSALSGSAERWINKIDLLLEEPNKKFFDFKDNPKKSKEKNKKTQTVDEKAKETIQTNKAKLLPKKNAPISSTFPPTQRKKIDTPTTSDQSPEVSESLRDLVKQKKRDFMESYKTKKQNHYDALRQQQKEQPFKKYVFLQSSQPTAFKYSRHYSVPHTMNRNFSPTEYAYPQSRLPPTPVDELKTKASSDIIYSTAAKPNEPKAQQRHSTSTPMAATTSSSTSMFCVSSDVSVPMGSNNLSSTPTTTHHYDDVAAAVAGVAVQTSGSIARGPQLHPYLCQQRKPTQTFAQPIITTTAAIQVRPRGIAYVIEFESDTNSNKSSNEPSTNLNALATESDIKVGGRIKTSSEPQMTLQDYLEKAKPKFLQQSQERKAILNELHAMRQARDRQLRDIIDNASFNSLERRLNYLPPPPTQKIRILNTKEMKALTNKRFVSLPEVVARKQREQEEKNRRGNRVLRDVFNRRLQRRVRSGKLSLNHSRTVI